MTDKKFYRYIVHNQYPAVNPIIIQEVLSLGKLSKVRRNKYVWVLNGETKIWKKHEGNWYVWVSQNYTLQEILTPEEAFLLIV